VTAEGSSLFVRGLGLTRRKELPILIPLKTPPRPNQPTHLVENGRYHRSNIWDKGVSNFSLSLFVILSFIFSLIVEKTNKKSSSVVGSCFFPFLIHAASYPTFPPRNPFTNILLKITTIASKTPARCTPPRLPSLKLCGRCV
jgi:hypothetical protein